MNRQGSILVVDDNEFNRDALSRRLGQKGFLGRDRRRRRPARWSVRRAGHYDLVLLDVEMPGMSGLDVLSRLRASRSQTELPVIMVTARAQSADIVEALEPWRERLRHQADRFPRRARAHPYASLAQMGRGGPARERRTVRGRRAGRERRPLGLEHRRRMRCTGRRAGRRCWDTKKEKSAPTRRNGSRASITKTSSLRRTRWTRTSRAEHGHYESEHRILPSRRHVPLDALPRSGGHGRVRAV